MKISRELFCDRGSGIEKLKLEIFDLEMLESSPDQAPAWRIRWRLEGIHPNGGFIVGEDQIDCLTNTFRFLDRLIIQLIEKGVRIWWLTPDDKGLLYPSNETA